ncbi:MAG: peptidase M15 [Muribaculaceae bacterium]|nr:peptidase M15 [Muribaculaceae bacterium]
MQLSENFNLEELTRSATAIRLGIDNTPGSEAKDNLRRLCREVLQPVRNRLKIPVIVTSGYRSKILNKAVGGAVRSQHLVGEAADIVCENNKVLWDLITDMIQSGEIEVGQLINEKNLRWIHVSLPSRRHRNEIFCLS